MHPPYVASGIAIVGAGAVVGALLPPPLDSEAAGQPAALASAATPNQLMAARLDIGPAAAASGSVHPNGADASAAIAALVGGFVTAINTEIGATHRSGVGIKALTAAFLAALAALTDSGMSTPPPDMDHEAVVAAIAALINGVAGAINAGIVLWDSAVTLGAAVVAHVAGTAAAIGAGAVDALSGAFLAALAALAPAFPIGAPAATAVATLVAGFSFAVKTGIIGLGAGIAWKAGLDAALAHALATGGVGIVNALAAGLLAALGAIGSPPPGSGSGDGSGDVADAFAALIGGAAFAINAGIVAWEFAVAQGAELVAHLATTTAAAAAGTVNALTDVFLSALAAFGAVVPIGAPLVTAVATVVAGLSVALQTGITGVGAAIAWKAALDATLARALATAGVGIVTALATGVLTALGIDPAESESASESESVRAVNSAPETDPVRAVSPGTESPTIESSAGSTEDATRGAATELTVEAAPGVEPVDEDSASTDAIPPPKTSHEVEPDDPQDEDVEPADEKSTDTDSRSDKADSTDTDSRSDKADSTDTDSRSDKRDSTGMDSPSHTGDSTDDSRSASGSASEGGQTKGSESGE